MEALFSTTLASYEAWLMVLCVIVFFGIYLFDGISFVQRVYAALRPAKPQGAIVPITGEASTPEITSPILEPIAPEEVEAHEAEKAKAEEKHEQEVIESEVFEEKILEEIQSAEEAEKKEELEMIEAIETDEEKTERKEEVQETVSEVEVAEKVSSTLDEPVAETTAVIEEGTGVQVLPEESEEAIENDLEEKEKIEEELLDVREGLAESEFTPEDSPDNKEEEIIIESTSPSEVSSELSDTIGEQVEQELPPEVENTAGEKDTEKKAPENTTDTSEEQVSSEEPHTLPITASIPETVPEVRKSTESQYTERLYGITNEVKTLIARGNTLDARALIIQGLALDKNHRELNLILGSIYESERQAQKAEYIYKDLALIYPEDGEILERLANILIIEKRYDLALEIYKKIVSLSGETEGSLYIMTHLAHELSHHEELYAYARRYQKNWPNNPDILTLLAQAEIALGERQAAIQTLIKLKNLTPYNNEIMETIAKLTMEEELAGNFASRENV